MSDDEAYEQLTQDMQAMCRDLSAHAETILQSSAASLPFRGSIRMETPLSFFSTVRP